MKQKNKNSTFNILRYITPRNVGARKGRLLYRYQSATVRRVALGLERDVWHEFLKSEPGSVEESALAEELSLLSMTLESSVLQSASDAPDQSRLAALAQSFTEHSIHVYGTQDVAETLQTMRQDMSEFFQLAAQDGPGQKLARELIEEYEKLGVSAVDVDSDGPPDTRLTPGDKEFRRYAVDVFQPIYGMIESDKLYSARAVKRLFSSVFGMFGRHDRHWRAWRASYKSDGSLAVDVVQRRILVGRNRAPAFGRELAASMSHEFVHMMRSVRAQVRGSTQLSMGISGYLPFEEGLGCYIEYVLSAQVPEKICNRQIAASLALGQLGTAYDRNAIYELLSKRTKVLMISHGTYSKELHMIKNRELKTLVIDRFFRGGSGQGPAAAVFTKDVVYSQGFAEVKRYVRSQLGRGVDPKALFDYLFAAKFDPLNQKHVALLRAEGVAPPDF